MNMDEFSNAPTNASDSTFSSDDLPEYVLIVRMMELAIQDATSKHDNDERKQARRWIFGYPTNKSLSASYVADVMGLDIELIREAISKRSASVSRQINKSKTSAKASRKRKSKEEST